MTKDQLNPNGQFAFPSFSPVKVGILCFNAGVRRYRLMLDLFALFMVGVVAYAVFVPSREPSYKGRLLSDWLLEGAFRHSATEALDQIGTNAIPYYLKWVQYEIPAWKMKLRQSGTPSLWNKLPARFKDYLRGLSREEKLALSVKDGFKVLGPKAEMAVPELSRLMCRSNFFVVVNAAEAISYLGPSALPPLLTALTNCSRPHQMSAIVALRNLGTNAGPAIPLLVQALTNPVPSRWTVARTLGELKMQPELVVPALTNLLHAPGYGLGGNYFMVEALMQYGTNAHAAVPALVNMLNDANPHLRESATNALRAIDPQALPGAR